MVRALLVEEVVMGSNSNLIKNHLAKDNGQEDVVLIYGHNIF